ncbi:hypothetical protein N0V95_001562 [Ascochyta clinopodiicola]|nr:hypothetical protein N0V95_001562 [Ascochyta clinopodiicola]
MEGTVGLDPEILKITNWLCTAYGQKIRLSGIIYLQSIGQNRMMGAAMRSLRMLEMLVGEENAGTIVLATTFWQEFTLDFALSREKELRKSFWQRLVKEGSNVMRQDRGKDSACEILQYLMDRRIRLVLALQREVVEEGLSLNQTGFGKELQAQLDSIRASCERRLETLEGRKKEELSLMTEGSRSEDTQRTNILITEEEEEALKNAIRDIEGASRQLHGKWDSLKRGITYPDKTERDEKDGDDERDLGTQDTNDEISNDSHEKTAYQSVALLVLRWENSVHKTGEDYEVARLKSVLGDRFNFDVSAEILLGSGIEGLERSQETINRAIINHIDLFDSPKTLLIIYYTGDAILQTIDGKKELMLAT